MINENRFRTHSRAVKMKRDFFLFVSEGIN